ncbi:hypothetical protein G6F43_009731 [Rhizopus delemar]|nr:hypothetical protein G6F43_009731 [Rhizopus delemar]
MEQLLADVQGLPQLTDDRTDHLLELISIDEIIHETARVENKISSSEEDGFGYAFLSQLFQYPPLQDLSLEAYDQALSSHTFPASWQGLRSMFCGVIKTTLHFSSIMRKHTTEYILLIYEMPY